MAFFEKNFVAPQFFLSMMCIVQDVVWLDSWLEVAHFWHRLHPRVILPLLVLVNILALASTITAASTSVHPAAKESKASSLISSMAHSPIHTLANSPIHRINIGAPTRERGRSYGGRLLKHFFKVTSFSISHLISPSDGRQSLNSAKISSQTPSFWGLH